MKRIVFWIVALVFFGGCLWIGWTFRANNAATVDLDLVWLEFPAVELWRVLLVSVALGMFSAGFVVGLAWLRARLLNRRYRAMVRGLEAELHQLRSLPLAGSEPPPDENEAPIALTERG